jgi:hypothetical protein
MNLFPPREIRIPPGAKINGENGQIHNKSLEFMPFHWTSIKN